MSSNNNKSYSNKQYTNSLFLISMILITLFSNINLTTLETSTSVNENENETSTKQYMTMTKNYFAGSNFDVTDLQIEEYDFSELELNNVKEVELIQDKNSNSNESNTNSNESNTNENTMKLKICKNKICKNNTKYDSSKLHLLKICKHKNCTLPNKIKVCKKCLKPTPKPVVKSPPKPALPLVKNPAQIPKSHHIQTKNLHKSTSDSKDIISSIPTLFQIVTPSTNQCLTAINKTNLKKESGSTNLSIELQACDIKNSNQHFAKNPKNKKDDYYIEIRNIGVDKYICVDKDIKNSPVVLCSKDSTLKKDWDIKSLNSHNNVFNIREKTKDNFSLFVKEFKNKYFVTMVDVDKSDAFNNEKRFSEFSFNKITKTIKENK